MGPSSEAIRNAYIAIFSDCHDNHQTATCSDCGYLLLVVLIAVKTRRDFPSARVFR